MKRVLVNLEEAGKKTTGKLRENVQERLAGETLEHFQEMAKVCTLRDDKCGIEIEIRSNDHGYISKGFLTDDKSPAHAHVFSPDGTEIGEINITGDRPKSIQQVVEYRPPKKTPAPLS